MPVHQSESTHAGAGREVTRKSAAKTERIRLRHFAQHVVVGMVQIPDHLLPDGVRGQQGVEAGIGLLIDKGRQIREDGIPRGEEIDLGDVAEDGVDMGRLALPKTSDQLVGIVAELVDINFSGITGRYLDEYLVFDPQAAEGETLFRRTRRRDQLGDVLFEADLQPEEHEHEGRDDQCRIHQKLVSLKKVIERDKYFIHRKVVVLYKLQI